MSKNKGETAELLLERWCKRMGDIGRRAFLYEPFTFIPLTYCKLNLYLTNLILEAWLNISLRLN